MTTVAAKPATMAQALTRALRDAMAADPGYVLGEDVGTLGGVFRVTDGLAAEFGEDRCTDTPLAEAGILGTAVGMAMYGLRPVVEMQFDAFAYPAFEQVVSHVTKMRNRTRGKMPLPLTIRVPYGGGIGGVEHHSDSSEAYYMATPGLHVVTPVMVVRWMVEVGDVVAVDQPVVEVETAKAMVEVPCPYGGVVTARFGEEGARNCRSARRCSRWRWASRGAEARRAGARVRTPGPRRVSTARRAGAADRRGLKGRAARPRAGERVARPAGPQGAPRPVAIPTGEPTPAGMPTPTGIAGPCGVRGAGERAVARCR
ncbi:hypothetical protein SVIOM342S_03623 [Streptomyces violaceorubidus]